MTDKYYRESTKYTSDGNEIEINQVVYERTDGKGIDYVEQTKCNGVEVGHRTVHPDGSVHNYGIYDDDKDDNKNEDKDEVEDDDDDEKDYGFDD